MRRADLTWPIRSVSGPIAGSMRRVPSCRPSILKCAPTGPFCATLTGVDSSPSSSSFFLFWTPLRTALLERVIGLSPLLAELSRAPLQIYLFFPFAVTNRAYLHSIAFFERRTKVMAVTAPMRIIAILVALLLLPQFGVQGAARGVAALLAGFSAETVTIWWLLLGKEQLGAWRARLAA